MDQLNLTKIAENKFLYTLQPFVWTARFAQEKGVTVITPLTTVASLLKLKANSEFYESIVDVDDGITRFLSVREIEKTVVAVNTRFKLPLVAFDMAVEKIVKSLFEVDDDLLVTKDFLEAYLLFLDARASKKQTIVLAGFDNLVFGNFKMLTVHLLITTLTGTVNWGNLQQLVMLDYADLGEILDRDRFKSWLELKARTVLTIANINDYFNGIPNLNSFLIDRALTTLKQ